MCLSETVVQVQVVSISNIDEQPTSRRVVLCRALPMRAIWDRYMAEAAGEILLAAVAPTRLELKEPSLN